MAQDTLILYLLASAFFGVVLYFIIFYAVKNGSKSEEILWYQKRTTRLLEEIYKQASGKNEIDF